jgi:hypothetical protein
MYMQQDDGSDILIPGKSKTVDLEVGAMWGRLGMEFVDGSN